MSVVQFLSSRPFKRRSHRWIMMGASKKIFGILIHLHSTQQIIRDDSNCLALPKIH